MRASLCALAALTLCGCTAIPHSGPSRSAVANVDKVELIRVTPEMARALAEAVAKSSSATQETNLAVWRNASGPSPEFRFSPGDVISLTLFSFPAPPGGTVTAVTSVEPSALGHYVVATDGTLQLPYVGRFAIAGLDLTAAQEKLTRRFVGVGLFRRPSIVIVVDQSPQNAILVTGAIAAPQRVPWTPAGRTLADTITAALGQDSSLLRETDDNRPKAAIEVDILREGQAPVTLPIARALIEDLAMRPGDRVIVRKEPKIFVSMLGGGVRQNGQLAFAAPPVLTDALARASGLDTNVADGHAVFVMRQRGGLKPALYDFTWDRASGMAAAQTFRLADGDIVYVAEAPIVALEKVVGLLFQIALPVQAAK